MVPSESSKISCCNLAMQCVHASKQKCIHAPRSCCAARILADSREPYKSYFFRSIIHHRILFLGALCRRHFFSVKIISSEHFFSLVTLLRAFGKITRCSCTNWLILIEARALFQTFQNLGVAGIVCCVLLTRQPFFSRSSCSF